MRVRSDLANYVEEQLAFLGRISTKSIFGGIGIFVDERLLGIVMDDKLDGTQGFWPGLYTAYHLLARVPGPRTFSGAATRPRDLLEPIAPPPVEPDTVVPSALDPEPK